ncbi:calcium-independent phospholipase A2-gamma [Hemiscyllium ocellatum]|uniref:calcium-independent phospholipase A2-gamma n=1 Tax=Hemiscyllium ocellatum TaxID=170820 RepID=UPI0029665E8B|nr:calcium-independent phospholipase A2-gamma [Hemiscyllium ocellatum]XP_060695478.1 calcium-independent phospholipase A2-gamma [Hemiscyllium ocellatum]
MSRIKSTLDSVSKAVSSTHTELIGKLVRLKPTLSVSDKVSETQIGVPCESSRKETTSKPGEVEDASDLNRLIENTIHSVSTPISLEPEDNSKDPSSNCVIDKENDGRSGLFHISYIATNFGETYNFLANHINNYFGNTRQVDIDKQDKLPSCDSGIGTDLTWTASFKSKVDKSVKQKIDHLNTCCVHPDVLGESPTPSAKKSFANLLSYPTNSVQAFVDTCFGSFAPKLRVEMKENSEVKNKKQKDVSAGKDVQQTNEKETKPMDDKAKHLNLQREKIIAKFSVDNRTRALVQALHRASDVRVYVNRVEELSYHLLEFPETRAVAVKEKIIPCLLRLRQANDDTLQNAVREALALIGYTDPIKGRGIRVLTIDGGGTRGLVALQTLRKLEELTGKQVYQLFDYICGVSTGAILAFMLGFFQIALDDCEEMYRKLGTDVFKQNVIVGTMKMGWSHAFYESEPWEKILKERMGEELLIQTARNPKSPKVAAVSTIVNKGTPLKAFVFRNYNHLPSVRSRYMGGCKYKLWQAIRASSAAPGYFQEYAIGNDLHQDGGLLINNPCALAIHECKRLWPNTPFQCVISLGTGRYEALGKNNVTYTSLKAKLTNVISSATDTEEVHTMLDALLPPDTYFRFNPFMSEDIVLDENRKEKLNQLQMDGSRYLERNEPKLKRAAQILGQEKGMFQKLSDWCKLKIDMYDGLPLISKL